MTRRTKQILIVAQLVLSALLAALVVTTGGGSPEAELGGPHGTPVVTVPLDGSAVDAAEAGLDDHEGARSEAPAGVSAAALDAGREQQEALAASDQLPAVTPLAAPSQRGCTTRLVQNYSSRRGVAPRLFVLHYTVSRNVSGWADVWAIAGLFDRASFAASSNYVLDNEGHCAYIVRESDKAWTQAGFNSVSISVEVVNTGHDATYVAAGMKQLAVIVHDAAKRWSIPLQLGAVSGCSVTRAGVVSHQMLGACGGGHHDISPYPIAPVIAAAKAVDSPVLPALNPRAPLCTVLALRTKLGLHPNGWIGPKVRDAIRLVQKRYGLKQTGYAGVGVSRALGLRGCAL